MNAARSNVRVVHLSTFDTFGGAARAAYNLHTGLRLVGCESSMFVKARASDDPHVMLFNPPMSLPVRLRRRAKRLRMNRDFNAYRLTRPDIPGDSFSDDRSIFDGNQMVRQLPECDIVNLHIVVDFVDYQEFLASVPPGVAVVWTLHDMTVFTGGCHYDYGCDRFTASCGACPQLGSTNEEDLSRQIWRRKQTAFESLSPERMSVIADSRWIEAQARRSSLLGRFPVTTIHYGLNTDRFAPRDKLCARGTLGIPANAKVVLFVADSLQTRRKGFALLAEALATLDMPNLFFLSVGYGKPELSRDVPSRHLSFLDDDGFLSLIYSAADVFVIPSLQEAFGQTALEAMACGTPVVGFATGGIPDMVRPGVTGALATANNALSLRTEIYNVLHDPEKLLAMSANCRRMVTEEFSLTGQARRYVELYETMLAKRRVI